MYWASDLGWVEEIESLWDVIVKLSLWVSGTYSASWSSSWSALLRDGV